MPELPPTRHTDNEKVEEFRELAKQAVNLCYQSELAETTVKAYDTILRVEVDFAVQSMDVEVLPMVMESQFTALFGVMLLARHKAAGDKLKWSRVRTLKSALMHWRKRRHTTCVFDGWTHSMGAF